MYCSTSQKNKCMRQVTFVVSAAGRWDEEDVQHAISSFFPACLKHVRQTLWSVPLLINISNGTLFEFQFPSTHQRVCWQQWLSRTLQACKALQLLLGNPEALWVTQDAESWQLQGAGATLRFDLSSKNPAQIQPATAVWPLWCMENCGSTLQTNIALLLIFLHVQDRVCTLLSHPRWKTHTKNLEKHWNEKWNNENTAQKVKCLCAQSCLRVSGATHNPWEAYCGRTKLWPCSFTFVIVSQCWNMKQSGDSRALQWNEGPVCKIRLDLWFLYW